MENIKKVLFSYGIHPTTITKITGAVYQIDDGQQLYALKKSRLTGENLPTWESTLHQAYDQQLTFVLPVFLTRDSALYKEIDQQFFYLTPWIDGKKSTIKHFYRSIGKIHAQTKQPQSVDQEQMINQFRDYKKFCSHMQQKVLTYVKQFENHQYMSPLELQVCTHYRDIELVLRKMSEHIDQFIDEQTEPPQWNYSLCHGNLRLSHLLEADQMYMINWEKASQEFAVMDLVQFFKNEVTTYDTPVESMIDSFKVYMKENKLNHSELFLLIIHLLDPTNYIEIVEQYVRRTSKLTMINQTKKLQITYRQLLFALQLSRYIEKEFTSILADNSAD